jgi:hypothetical protein
VAPGPGAFGLGGGRAGESEDDYLQAGLTIYLPGEEMDPVKLMQNPTPYTVRIRPMQADGEVSVEDFQRMVRGAFAQLLKGHTLRIAPRRSWRLLRNPALAAELGEKERPDVLLIEERWGDPEKPLPDALYRLARMRENEFLLDLIQRWEAEGPDEFDPSELLGGDEGSEALGGWQFGGGGEDEEGDGDDPSGQADEEE